MLGYLLEAEVLGLAEGQGNRGIRENSQVFGLGNWMLITFMGKIEETNISGGGKINNPINDLSRNIKQKVHYASLGFQRNITGLETSICGWHLNQEIGGITQAECRWRRKKAKD